MADLVYFCGAPGAGKTTLMAALTEQCEKFPVSAYLPHVALVRGGKPVAAEMGKRRDKFSGTDALSMSIHPQARRWLDEHPYRLILGEGNRLGNLAFMDSCKLTGYTYHLVYLTCDEPTLLERRYSRGSKQNTAWMAGAATQAARLAEGAAEAGNQVVTLDSTGKPDDLVREVLSAIPALEVLVG